MFADVLLHLLLEAAGAAAMRIAWAYCPHWRHRLLTWALIAIPLSYLTVKLVG